MAKYFSSGSFASSRSYSLKSGTWEKSIQTRTKDDPAVPIVQFLLQDRNYQLGREAPLSTVQRAPHQNDLRPGQVSANHSFKDEYQDEKLRNERKPWASHFTGIIAYLKQMRHGFRAASHARHGSRGLDAGRSSEFALSEEYGNEV